MNALPLSVTLSGTPNAEPRYKVVCRSTTGLDVVCGDPRATRALVALMDLEAVNGGAACHWGGPAGLAEIMSAIHAIMFKDKTKVWHEHYNFVNDVGHAENGVYALRANLGFGDLTFESLKGFRKMGEKLTGHGESHLYPDGVYLSNGPLGSSIPQAQGLALADKLLGNSRVTIQVISDGASMEGEAKEAYAAIPGLAMKGKMNPFVLVISDNNTKLSGRIDKDAFSMAPTFAAMAALGWKTIHVEKGNDLQTVLTVMEEAIESARANSTQPVCVICKTVKGFGVKSTMDSASGGHGFPVKKCDPAIVGFVNEIWSGQAPQEFIDWAHRLCIAPAASPSSGPKKEKVQAGVSKAAILAVKEGLPVMSVSADLAGSTGMSGFQKEYPDRSIDIGVAESNMVSCAAGLSKKGFIPIVDTFAAFGVTKGNLPLCMASLSQAPVIGMFSHTGFQDAADGASHQSTNYFSAVGSIPHVTLISLSSSSDAEYFVLEGIRRMSRERQAGHEAHSLIYFLGREDFVPSYIENPHYEWGKAQVLREGSDAVIVATGPTVAEALKAHDLLKEKGVSAAVVNSFFINHPDVDTIKMLLAKAKGCLITVEDHQVIGGMGAMLVHALVTHGVALSRVQTLGVKGEFGQSSYTAKDLYARHGIDAKGIVDAVIGKP